MISAAIENTIARSLPECLERLVEGVLARIGVEAPEDVGCGVFLELDGGDQTQQDIPIITNQRLIDCLVRLDDPALLTTPIIRFENVEGLLTDALDTRGKGKAQQVRQPKDGFGVAVAISRMDITLHNVVAHEPVGHIGALSVGSADHQRMPEDVAFIDERVCQSACNRITKEGKSAIKRTRPHLL